MSIGLSSRVRAAAFGLAVLASGLTACGDSSQVDVQREQMTEQRIQQERADAAHAARQEERLKRLERQLKAVRKRKPATRTVAAPSAPSTTSSAAPTPDASIGDWPGGSGFTVVLASATSQTSARATQRRASDTGLDAGVLNSSNFTSLRAGYWVVFSGRFTSQNDASARQSRARSLGFSDAYARFVSR